MAEGLKSAWELAREKTERLHEEAKQEQVPLTAEQRTRMAEIEKEFKAKIAEREVMLQAEIRTIITTTPPPEARERILQVQERFASEKEGLKRQRGEQLEKVRQAGGA